MLPQERGGERRRVLHPGPALAQLPTALQGEERKKERRRHSRKKERKREGDTAEIKKEREKETKTENETDKERVKIYFTLGSLVFKNKSYYQKRSASIKH